MKERSLARKIGSFCKRAVRDVPFAVRRLSVALGADQNVHRVGPNGHVMILRRDDWRAWRIAQAPLAQDKTLGLWEALARLKPELAFDVGANYGEFAAAILDQNIRMHLFEPNGMIATCLRKTFADQPNVNVYDVAVSDREGEAKFHFNPTYSGGGSLSDDAAQSSPSPYVSRKTVSAVVTVTTLDRVVKECDLAPKSFILKVDTEGSEQAVLRGGRDLLKGSKWWRAVIEFIPDLLQGCGTDPHVFWSNLRQYSGFVIQSSAEIPDLRDLTGLTLPGTFPPNFQGDIVIGSGCANDE